MTSNVSFQTRARAIDHLGRGQIADCPTAVTELWKNAYDAYARNVSLHLYEGDPHVAAIFDDGCGMTRDDVDNKWLVIGTESKTTGDEVPEEDRFELPVRPKLGEKGIGRLSAGYLAPVTLLVSKKIGEPFVAALVDWRFFENPYLLISDVGISVDEFDSIDELPKVFEQMVSDSKGVLAGSQLQGEKKAVAKERKRIKDAWVAFSADETANKLLPTTETRIKALTASKVKIEERLSDWSVATGETDHGTALVLVDLHRELSVWVDPKVDLTDEEAMSAKNNLKATLAGFVDPDDSNMQDFAYYVEVHRRDRRGIEVDSNKRVGSSYLESLEHYVHGKVSADGWFSGTVTAFGVKQKNVKIRIDVPSLRNKQGNPKVGEFTVEIAAIEEPEQSTHGSDAGAIKKRMKTDGGMMVYRDGVRVLPYGRPENDFFALDARRGKHAGREFWAHRRIFGRVKLSRQENPNLRDKAGREGLVDNEAKRLLKLAVTSLLMTLARRYFGTDSPIRENEVEKIRARNERGKEAVVSARKRRRKEFLSDLRNATKVVAAVEPAMEEIASRLKEATKSKNANVLSDVLGEVDRLKEELEVVELSPIPKGLDEKEGDYRDTRDALANMSDEVTAIEESALKSLEKLKGSGPQQTVDEYRAKQVKSLERQVKRNLANLKKKCDQLGEFWDQRCIQTLEEFEENSDLEAEAIDEVPVAIEEIQHLVSEIESSFLGHSQSVCRSIDLMLSGIDIDSALAISDETQLHENERVRQLNLLAQTGVAVELIGHDLEEMAQETESNFGRMSDACKKSAAYKRAFNGFAAIVDRFRFLSPFSVASYRARREITGEEISEFVSDFFERRFENMEIDFKTTRAFDKLVFKDLPSRIFPVFVNLVNNSLYWLKFTPKNQIRFDLKDGLVIVADSGPGVDADDVESLFQMFFTKRPQGRGIGLYLCKTNLAVARHEIRYANSADPKILSGANFIIEFRGLSSTK